MANDVDSLREYPRGSLPRHLFRAFSGGSRGVNSPTQFISNKRYVSGSREALPLLNHDIFDGFARDAAAHMQNLRKDQTFCSPLISFTNRLLVALIVAESMRRRNIPDIVIAMLDTRSIESRNPIFSAARLRNVLNKRPENRSGQIKGQIDEYLAYDCLEVRSSYATYVDLLQIGLLTHFLPELWGVHLAQLWPKPTQDLRHQRFKQRPTRQFGGLPILHQICFCFRGQRDFLSLKVQFLSLRWNDFTLKELVLEALRGAAVIQLRDFLTIRFQYLFEGGTGSYLFIRYAAGGHRHEGNLPEHQPYKNIVNAMCVELFESEERKLFDRTGKGIKDGLLSANDRAMTNLKRIARNAAFEPGVAKELRELGVLRYVDSLDMQLVAWQLKSSNDILNHETTRDIKKHLLQTTSWAEKIMQLVRHSNRRGSSDSMASTATTDGSVASCTSITTRTTTTTTTETIIEEFVFCTTPGPALLPTNPISSAPTMMTEPAKRKARPDDDDDERPRAEGAKKIKLEL